MKENKKSKSSVKHSYTNKSYKKWTTFSWFLFGLILFAGVGYATTINEWSTTSNQITFGNTSGLSGQVPNRDLVSTLPSGSTKNITVCSSGCDYTTIQEAINEVPYMLRQKYFINVSSGTYNEDIWVPPILVADILSPTEGSVGGLQIKGNCADLSAVKVKSIHITGANGANSLTINCFQVTGQEPTSDENASVIAYGSDDLQFSQLNITGTVNNAITLYSSYANMNRIYVNSNQQYGLFVKRSAKAVVGDEGSDSVLGLVGSTAVANYRAHDGWIDIVNLSTSTVSCDKKGGIIKYHNGYLCGNNFLGTNDGSNLDLNLTASQTATRYLRIRTTSTGVILNGVGSTSNRLLLGAGSNTQNIVIDNKLFNITSGNLSIYDLRGSGNDYACLDANGQLFRSNTAC